LAGKGKCKVGNAWFRWRTRVMQHMHKMGGKSAGAVKLDSDMSGNIVMYYFP
jgi:hypothetical protein